LVAAVAVVVVVAVAPPLEVRTLDTAVVA